MRRAPKAWPSKIIWNGTRGTRNLEYAFAPLEINKSVIKETAEINKSRSFSLFLLNAKQMIEIKEPRDRSRDESIENDVIRILVWFARGKRVVICVITAEPGPRRILKTPTKCILKKPK